MKKINFRILNLTTALVLIFLYLSGTELFPQQQPTIEVLEIKFEQVEATVDKLSQQRSELNRQIEDDAQKIQELKSKKQLNYLERQRLEALLKNSQDLSDQISVIDSKLRESNEVYSKTGRELTRLYDSEIKRALNSLEQKNTSKELRQALYMRIEHLRKRKENTKQKIGQQDLQDIKISKLQISKEDTPRQIEQKADLLKDQEDKFRRQSQQLNHRAKDLQKELDLRNRIEDLVTDLALFDQQEEAISNLSSSTSQTSTDFVDEQLGEVERVSTETQENVLVGQKDFDFSILSTEQLEETIENLKNQQKLAESQADSLGKQAEKFYQAAEELKKQ